MKDKQLGFIGLGQMGLPMACNLVKAGYRVRGFDLKREALDELAAAGGSDAPDADTVVRGCDVVITCLVSPPMLATAANCLIPLAREGQIFIDHSTLPAPRARDIAAQLRAKGARPLDVPVSGGWQGAQRGALHMFAGGDRALFDACRELLEVNARPGRLLYGGESGKGQAMKVVQQLRDRILDAARMEVLAFGVRSGFSLEQTLEVMDIELNSGDGYAKLVAAIKGGRGDELSCLFSEYPYYLEEAAAQSIPMPILESLYQFAKDAPTTCKDGQGRPMPSLWNELISQRGPALPPR